MSILDEIIANKKVEIEIAKKKSPLNSFINKLEISKRNFKKTISQFSNLGSQISLIAEIKKASPSEGIIRKNFNHIEIAKIYQKYAQAISILTDEKFFQGSLTYLKEISEFSKTPLLRKDFIIDEYQIYESRYFGADAILLIVSCLNAKKIEHFIEVANNLGMASIIEIHNEEELEKIKDIKNIEIIGINNRNLKTFKTDLNTTIKLSKSISALSSRNSKLTIVTESGINSKEDFKKIQPYSDAALIGTTFMRSENIEETIKEFMR